MMYYYERPENWEEANCYIMSFNHPLYFKATVFRIDEKAVSIIQMRHNSKTKMTWYGPIDPWLAWDITQQLGWVDWLCDHAEDCKNGLYPTYNIRQVMWALRMKPLKKEPWEDSRKLQ